MHNELQPSIMAMISDADVNSAGTNEEKIKIARDIPTTEDEKLVEDEDVDDLEDGDVDDPASKTEPLDPVAVEEALKMIREFKPKKARRPLPLFPGGMKM